MTFEENCEKLNITTKDVTFKVTEDVYNELKQLEKNNDCTLQDFLRDMIDYFLIQSVD